MGETAGQLVYSGRENLCISAWYGGVGLLVEDLERHRPALRRYLTRQLGTVQGVDDFVQEVFLRAHRARLRRSFRSTQAYLFTTAKNLVIDHRRKKATHFEETGSAESDQAISSSADPELLTLLTERMSLLRRAIHSLPPRCRQAFVLRKFHHQSYRRIAERMGISEKTVEKHLAKALLLCREYLTGAERGGSAIVDFERHRQRRSHPHVGPALRASETREPS